MVVHDYPSHAPAKSPSAEAGPPGWACRRALATVAASTASTYLKNACRLSAPKKCVLARAGGPQLAPLAQRLNTCGSCLTMKTVATFWLLPHNVWPRQTCRKPLLPACVWGAWWRCSNQLGALAPSAIRVAKLAICIVAWQAARHPSPGACPTPCTPLKQPPLHPFVGPEAAAPAACQHERGMAALHARMATAWHAVHACDERTLDTRYASLLSHINTHPEPCCSYWSRK